MKTSTPPKYLTVKDSLIRSIRAGEIKPGSRVPAERQLADQFRVSHMTARRAIDDLVEENVLERRPRDGTYLRHGTPDRLSTETVQIIIPAFEGSIGRQLLFHARNAAAVAGWSLRVVRVAEDDNRAAIQALASGARCMIWLWGEDLDRIHKQIIDAAGRVVVFGSRLEADGIPSVVADDVQALVLATTRLYAAGHRRIGLLADGPQECIRRVQIAAWRSCVEAWDSPEAVSNRLVTPRPEHAVHMVRAAYETVSSHLASGKFDATALISVDDNLTIGALAAFRDRGWAVPSQVSLINCGDSDMMEFGTPSVTSIDVNLKRHVEIALQLLERSATDELPPTDMLHFVQPVLVERKSVASPSHAG